MKAWNILILFICLSTTTWAQTSEKEHSEEKTTWETLDKAAYEISYPTDWEMDESNKMGTEFILSAPVNTNKAQLRTNINLLIQDISDKNWNLDDFASFSLNQIKTLMSESEIIKNEKGNFNNSDYQNIIFSASMHGRKIFFEQFYWVVGSKAFILTYTGNQSEFDAHTQIRKKMFESFKLDI